MRINIINKKTYVEGRETVRILRTKYQAQSDNDNAMIKRKIYLSKITFLKKKINKGAKYTFFSKSKQNNNFTFQKSYHIYTFYKKKRYFCRKWRQVESKDTIVSRAKFTCSASIFTRNQKLRRVEIIRSQ